MILFDIRQVSEKLRLAPITVRRRVRAGEIPYRKMGGKIFFTPEDLAAYLEASAVPAKPVKEACNA
jgi:excisionase family DNA binding protein